LKVSNHKTKKAYRVAQNMNTKLYLGLIIVIVYTGNVVNGTIGKQMVDTLVESASNVEVKFDLFEFVCIEVFKNLTDDINFAAREI
jgi:hypothetical protein